MENVKGSRCGAGFEYRGEGDGWIALGRPGWVVKIRNVRMRRLAPAGCDWLVEPLAEGAQETEWIEFVLEGEGDVACLHLPQTSRLTQRMGRAARIDRRTDTYP